MGKHFAYRLCKPTLEPVARVGDILLVKEFGEPSAKSLVVAGSDDRILARRFEIAENNSDVTVLTAQAINPREIAPPLVAHKGTLTLHKVVGVLFDRGSWGAPPVSEMEACDCGGEAIFTNLSSEPLGLVEVVGQSAEPHALDGQYLVVGGAITSMEKVKGLDGRPVIAADNDGHRYFKRLRLGSNFQVVLESLDAGGEYGPVILSVSPDSPTRLEHVWPVIGVLFELPN